MQCERHVISVAIGAIMTLASTSLGQAEIPRIDDFNCPEIIIQMMGEPERLQWQSPSPELFLIAHSEQVVLPAGNDIMNADEHGAGKVREDVFEAANNDGVVGCALIAVRFIDPLNAQREVRTISQNRNTEPGTGREFLPILLMRRFNTPADHDYALTRWQTDDFNIELLAGDDPDTPEVEPRDLYLTEAGAPVPFGPYLVNSIEYLGEDLRLRQTGTRALQFVVQDLSSDQSRYLATFLDLPSDRRLADMAVVICSPDPCNDLLPASGASPSLSQPIDAPAVTIPMSGNGGVAVAGSQLVFEANAETQPSEMYTAPAGSQMAFEANAETEPNEIYKAPPAQRSEPPAPDPASTSTEMQINLTLVDGEQGQLDAADIACLLDALGTEVRRDPEHACREEIISSGAASTLVIEGPTNWRLELRRRPEPSQINVTLPNTVEALTCGLDVVIRDGTSGDGVKVALDPPDDGKARGATFVGRWPHGLKTGDMDEVTLLLRPISDVGCGGPARELTVPVTEVINVSLLPDGTTGSTMEIAHIMAFQAADLAMDFQLDTRLQDYLSDQILAATSMAHVHLDQSIGTASSLISAAIFGRIGADGRPITATFTAAELEPSSILAQTVYSGFEQVGFTHSASTQPGYLERSIHQLAQEAEARGATALHVNLFGPVLSRTTVDPNAVCEDVRLTQELTLRDLPIHTSVAAYPLVGMESDEEFDVSDLIPLSLPSGAERLPSGLMRCRNTGPDLTILPYFIEAWRSPRDLPARYTSAIGDQLATALIATVAELETHQ